MRKPAEQTVVIYYPVAADQQVRQKDYAVQMPVVYADIYTTE
jgi:hypothetical protein